jgi:hypothetical protein
MSPPTTASFVDFLNGFNTAGASHEKVFEEYNASDSPFSEALTIETDTEQFIRKNFSGPAPVSVILTGYAGTGKTRLCRIAHELISGTKKPLTSWDTVEIARNRGGLEAHIVKDLSQLPDAEAATLMQTLAQEVEGGGSRRIYLVAANEGKLRNAMKDNPLRKLIDAQLRGEVTDTANVRVINLGRTTSSTYVPKLLGRMTDEAHWHDCGSCGAVGSCILRYNRDQLARPETSQRVQMLYNIVEHQGTRITLRDTLIHLVYTLTGGLSCEDVQRESEQAGSTLHYSAYYQNCWGSQPEGVEVNAASVVTHLQRIPVGENSVFEVDEFIIYGTPNVSGPAVEEHRSLFGDSVDLAGTRFDNERLRYLYRAGEGQLADRFLQEWLTHCRRKVFFEWSNTEATDRLLPFRSSGPYFALLNKTVFGGEKDRILKTLVRALNCVFTGRFITESESLYLPSGYRDEYVRPDPLILGVRNSSFELTFDIVAPSPHDLDVSMPQLMLRDTPTGERLELDLLTFEYLMRLGVGGSLDVLAEECNLKIRDFQDRILRSLHQHSHHQVRFLAFVDQRYQVITVDPDEFRPSY